jgi:hypothetical protein
MARSQKISVVAELKKLEQGKKTKADVRLIAWLALPWVKAGLACAEEAEVEELFRLFRL